MLNEPRIYRHSSFQMGFVIFIFGILAIGLLTTMIETKSTIMIPFGFLFAFVFLFAIYSVTSKTIIADAEISTQTLLGTKSLAWNEIGSVSGSGYAIKLHDNFGNVTIAPNQQLPGYEEVINWIGAKRPDLFNSQEYSEMSRSWLSTIFFPVFGLFFVGFGVFLYTQSGTFFPIIMLGIIGAIFIGMTFTSAQAVAIQGNSLVIGYLFSERTLLANEVASIALRFTQTRNGKNYFVAINLTNRKIIRVSGLSTSLPIVYLVLKNWHKKNTSS